MKQCFHYFETVNKWWKKAPYIIHSPQLCSLPLDGERGRGEGASLFLHKKFQILSVSLFLQILFWNEPQRCGIHAVPKPRRRRPIVEDMAEMGIAMFTPDFGARHEKADGLPSPRYSPAQEAW